jgi:hypothetical protein
LTFPQPSCFSSSWVVSPFEIDFFSEASLTNKRLYRPFLIYTPFGYTSLWPIQAVTAMFHPDKEWNGMARKTAARIAPKHRVVPKNASAAVLAAND